MKGMKIMFVIMILSLLVAFMWDSLPVVKQIIHLILDPTAGVLLDKHVNIGMLLITGIIALITTLLQKYATDQNMLKEIKAEQKIIQEEMKLAKSQPEKTMELSKKSLELTMKAMPITMRPLVYTIIPFVLLFRWFGDYFVQTGAKVFGMSWLLGYILLSLIMSTIFRKVLKVH
jgi:uncharacterized membrane protein (DUF106 family)